MSNYDTYMRYLVGMEATQPIPPEPSLDWFYVQDGSGKENTLTFTPSTNSNLVNPEYSMDGETWTSIGTISSVKTLQIPANRKVYLRAIGAWGGGSRGFNPIRINCTGTYYIGGNILSLSWGSYFTGEETDIEKYTNYGFTFAGLFQNSTNLQDASKLSMPATGKFLYHEYDSMFRGCSQLLEVSPNLLPFNRASTYMCQYMFAGCTHLKKTPELNVETYSTCAYYNMFQGCSSLNYVKMHYTQTPEPGNPYDTFGSNFLNGVSQNGNLYYPTGVEYNPNTLFGTSWTLHQF